MHKFRAGDKVLNVGETRETWGGRDGPVIGEVYTVREVIRRDSGEYLSLVEFYDKYPRHSRRTGKYALIENEETPAFDLLSALTGKPLKFRSGGEVKFVAYAPDAKPHCQLVLLSIATGNIVLRYANGKGSDEPYSEPGDILNAEAV